MPLTEIRSLPEKLPGWWKALLEEWGQLLDSYCGLFPDDAPYWHGERALTGLLAAAAWRLPQGWSLEEVSPVPKRGSKRGGRLDAWVGQGPGSWCAVECKVPPVYASDLKNAVKQVRRGLDEAGDELARLDREYRGDCGVAVSYFVPNLAERRLGAASDKGESLLNGLASHFQTPQMVVATYRPPGTPFRMYDGRLCPGIVLIGEAVAPSKGR